MNMIDHGALRAHCMQIRKLEQAKVGIELQISAIERSGMPSELIMPTMHATLGPMGARVDELKAALPSFIEGSPLADWIEAYKGLGPAIVYGLGLMPPLSPDWIPDPSEDPPNYMRGVRACWKYAGLDVRDGRAPKRTAGEFSGFNAFLKAIWIYRVGVSIEKTSKDRPGEYRAAYDARKLHTLVTHPPMLELGVCEFCDAARSASQAKRAERNITRERKAPAGDCAGAGGPHWSDGHRRADALRYLAKQVLKDAWLVANDKLPSVGHRLPDEPVLPSPQAAA
jgi:hypothetical protein